jgi:hypothetical protein
MKKLVAIAALGTMVIGVAPAHAGGAATAALALSAFAVFNQLVLGPVWARSWYEPVYVAPPAVYSAPVYAAAPAYAPAPAYAGVARASGPPPPPPVQREVVYPHGRYLLYGDGVRMPYQWVWMANPSPPPPPPPPPAEPQQ